MNLDLASDPLHVGRHRPPGAGVYEGELDGVKVVAKFDHHDALLTEFEVLSRFTSRRLPRVLDFSLDQERDLHCLVLERLPGVGMDTLIGLSSEWKSQTVTTREAVSIVSGLACCIDHVSKAGYLYRDLNFAHVLVDVEQDDPSVRLIDFEGCVRKAPAGVAVLENTRGTWETMSPEEFRVGASMSEASLTYSLGIVLMQLVSGGNPFWVSPQLIPDFVERQEVVAQMHSENRAVVPEINGSVGAMVARALQPDPGERFSTISAFRQALCRMS